MSHAFTVYLPLLSSPLHFRPTAAADFRQLTAAFAEFSLAIFCFEYLFSPAIFDIAAARCQYVLLRAACRGYILLHCQFRQIIGCFRRVSDAASRFHDRPPLHFQLIAAPFSRYSRFLRAADASFTPL